MHTEAAEELLSSRRIAEALARYAVAERAGEDADRCAAGRWMCHMLNGEYGHAWGQSDLIRQRGTPDPLRFWNGEAIDGKRLLIRCLHGFGDTVQYLRWLPLLSARCADVTVQAAPHMLPLLRLFADAGRVITWNAPGESDAHLWDVQVECAELPYLFRAETHMLPPPSRIVVDEFAAHRVRGVLGQRTRPRVALAWTGSSYDPSRSIPFEAMLPILSNHTVEFWSLQSQNDSADWRRYAERHGWGSRATFVAGIDELAVVTSEMDLVITIDSLAAHIAGSVGVPTWLLLKHAADWRWMIEREDSPWYPTMKLFRQPREGDWGTVIQRVCDWLRDWGEEKAA